LLKSKPEDCRSNEFGLVDAVSLQEDRLSQLRARIEALVAIAAEHGAPVRLEDVILLLPFSAFRTVPEFAEFLSNDPLLRSRLTLSDQFLVNRERVELLTLNPERGRMTSWRIAAAQAFVDRLSQSCPWLIIASVSGSTIYRHANPEDDLDFFLVVGRRRMWVTLLTAFLLARTERERRKSPPYCFNRTLEDYECIRDLNAHQEPLVAREALSMLVLRGERYYASLIAGSDWMRQYFPVLYDARTVSREHGDVGDEDDNRKGGVHWSFFNGVAFMIVAPYLAAMGLVRNARLKHQGRFGAQFRTVVRLGFCAFESNRYEELRETYNEVIR